MKSLAELQAIKDRVKNSVQIRENNDVDYRIVVGMATCGIAAGARPVLNACTEEVAKRSLHNVMVTQTGCIGICKFEPVAEVFEKDGTKTTYVNLSAEKMVRIINDHIVNGNVVTEFTIGANA